MNAAARQTDRLYLYVAGWLKDVKKVRDQTEVHAQTGKETQRRIKTDADRQTDRQVGTQMEQKPAEKDVKKHQTVLTALTLRNTKAQI